MYPNFIFYKYYSLIKASFFCEKIKNLFVIPYFSEKNITHLKKIKSIKNICQNIFHYKNEIFELIGNSKFNFQKNYRYFEASI